jgi:2-C-methyl-D-erythritol 4-phosphate cytidylyltransferase
MDGTPPTFVSLILAAGEGSRLGGSTPKPWIEIQGEALLSWSLQRLEALPGHLGSVVAMEEASFQSRWPIIQEKGTAPRIGILGGESRQESAQRAFQAFESQEGSWTRPKVLLVHDAARPFFPLDATKRLIQRAFDIGGALLAFPVRDTLKACGENGRVLSTVPRENLFAAATPQAFALDTFRKMLTEAAKKGIKGTDEAMLAEALGIPLEVIPCPSTNLKITYPEDLALLPCLTPLLHQEEQA